MAIQGASKTSCRAVYEKFKDGTIKDISDELPFEIPGGWALVRLESLGFYHGGHTPSMSEPSFWGGNILWVSAKDMKCDVIIDTQDKITHKGAAALQMVNADSLVLVTRSGILKHTFPVAIVKTPCTINQDLKAFVPYCTEVTQYLALCLRALQAVILKRYRKKGMTVQSIIWESFIRMPIPLPPLAEQKRIMAKIEKLMPLVEEYGKMEEARLQLDADLPTTLEKSILQEAIQGKLVQQDPNDEPACELLRRIAAERKALVKAGKLKRGAGESVIFRDSDRLAYETRNGETMCIQDEIPFEIPDSWEWVRLGDILHPMTSKKPTGEKFDYIDIDAIDNKQHIVKVAKTLQTKGATSRASREVKSGDVLFSMVRPYLRNIALIDEGYAHCIASTGFYVCRPSDVLYPPYLYHLMLSDYVVMGLNESMKGLNSPGITTGDLQRFPIPLPPLAEQKRIVAKIEDLRAVIKSLTT